MSDDKRWPLVIVVLLVFRENHDLFECLDSLGKSSYPNFRVLIISLVPDINIDLKKTGLNQYVQFHYLSENKGYAGNNNIGIRWAIDNGAEWVFILNDDTIIDPDCITRLIEVGERYKENGVLGPLVYHYDEPQWIQSAGGWINQYWVTGNRGINEVDQGQFQEEENVDWISGCGIMVRRDLLAANGFDEQFFLYNEEVEFCYRAKSAGWKIVFVPEARMWHKGVQRNYQPGPNVTYYVTRNQLLFLKKHRAPLKAWFFNWFTFIRTVISWTLRPKWRGKREHRDAMVQGMIDYLRGNWGMRRI